MTADHDHDATDESECQQALDTLYRYLDGELNAASAAAIRRHLSDCSPCLEAYDFQAELRMVVARKCRESAPDSLRIKVMAALRACAQEVPTEPRNQDVSGGTTT